MTLMPLMLLGSVQLMVASFGCMPLPPVPAPSFPELTALHGEATREGVLLRFDDQSFEIGTTQLNMASRDRLDQLVGLLHTYTKLALTIRRVAPDTRYTDTQRRMSVGRTAAIEHYLLRSGVAENRVLVVVSRAHNGSAAEGAGPVIDLIIDDSSTS